MNYEDNPNSNLEYLKSLSKNDLKMYINGYMLACIHMREALSRGKLDILNYILESKDPVRRKELNRALALLDKYENSIRDKEHKLGELFPGFIEKPESTLGSA